MNLVSIHKGLADENRLRIVSLLTHGPLGVKHLQGILGISQVRVSKHLAYLLERGLVEKDRNQNWMLYRLPSVPGAALKAHLDCLRECTRGVAVFEADQAARRAVESEVEHIQRLPRRGAVRPQRDTKTVPTQPESAPRVGLGSNGEGDYVD